MADDRLSGVVIEESLLDDTVLALVQTVQTEHVEATDATPDQPARWVLRHFEASAARCDELATAFDVALRPGPWYVDFVVGDDHVVVFSGRTFRYRRTDRAGAADARAHGRRVGVPESQLDWED